MNQYKADQLQLITNDTGHWLNTTGVDISTVYGFVYIITNKLNGRRYVGCKQIKTKKNSNWKTYTGSSKALNSDIAQYGVQHFSFEILSVYYSRSWLKLAEATEIITRKAITSPDYYNELLYLRIRMKKQ